MAYVLGDEQHDDHGGTKHTSMLIDQVDPRARIIAALIFAIIVVSSTTIAALILALVMGMVALLISRAPALKTLKRMALMDGFILILLLLLPFTIPGEPIFSVFGQHASFEGAQRAVVIALKANGAVLMLLVLVGTLEPAAFGHALARLKTPSMLIHLLMFTVRYIDVLHEEYGRARMAMKARGFRLTNAWHTYRSLGYLVGMMLIRAVERSERILAAMKCRGFSGHVYLLDDYSYHRIDTVFAAVALATVALIAAANYPCILSMLALEARCS